MKKHPLSCRNRDGVETPLDAARFLIPLALGAAGAFAYLAAVAFGHLRLRLLRELHDAVRRKQERGGPLKPAYDLLEGEVRKVLARG